MKKIIYSESNFKKVKINNDYFYIDKTKHIESLENLNESFMIFYAQDDLESLYFSLLGNTIMMKIQLMSLMLFFMILILVKIQLL